MHLSRKSRQALGYAIAITIVAIAGLAWASAVHLKGGRSDEPRFVDRGSALEARGELVGRGNGDVLITMWTQANVIATCTNPGGNQAPGQNPAPIEVMGLAFIPEERGQHGNTRFRVETEAPAPVIEGAPDCPNDNWTEEIDDLAFTSATIVVEQPVGTVVLEVHCSFDPPTEDGPVHPADVECTQR